MRVNIYAEEMTDRLEIITKEIDGHKFTALRFYLELPCTTYTSTDGSPMTVSGPFIHRPGDDDSAAVTFWGKQDLRVLLRKAIAMLDEHYGDRPSIKDAIERERVLVQAVNDAGFRVMLGDDGQTFLKPDMPSIGVPATPNGG